MMLTRIFAGVVTLSALAACDPVNDFRGIGAGTVPVAQSAALDPAGNLPDPGFGSTGVSGNVADLAEIDGALTGYRFAYGRLDGTDQFLGQAGFASTSSVGAALVSGDVTYTGTYNLALIGEVEQIRDGNITLLASLLDNTLTGSAGGLVVNGTFGATTALDGTVSFGGVTADLDGAIGAERVVGAFAGDSASQVLVGGIVAAAPPP
ncbi:hypothetical protein [Yoonia sp. SS1-5]|uniref:Transferrin-binding protein B C-lobe/N-lobe beta barrel domain-containing protein n=1 Tax=Yoonia rhodophyticola TaxID=3137370 RepID=A0AAN0MF64_9RHOB